MSRIFRNPDNQRKYDETGFIISDFFSSNEVKSLLHDYEKLNPVPKKGFHSTQGHASSEYRREVYNVINKLANPKIAELFVDYTQTAASFVVKEADATSGVRIHQDWNVTKESVFVAFNIWVSLVDTNKKNGALYLLPGSHKLHPTLRGPSLPDPCENCQNISLNKFFYEPVKAGQAVIYDIRTLHASPPNLSNQRRIACAIGVIPKQAKLLHYSYSKPENKISEYSVSSEFFLHFSKDGAYLKGIPAIDLGLPNIHKFTPQELSHLFKRPTLFDKLSEFLS